MAIPTTKVHEWARDGFIISTDTTLIDVQALNAAFESDQLPWARALPEAEMRTMLEKSVCFGLYSPTAKSLPTTTQDTTSPASEQSPADTLHEVAERVHNASDTPQAGQGVAMIGLARLITDCVTVIWLTDVYVLPEWQGQGLGSWLNKCIKDWVDMMPHLRRLSLIAAEGRMEQTYAKVFGTSRMEDEGTGYRIYSAKGKGGQL